MALARALVNLPKVLLLDEPLGALDLKLRKGLQVELKRIQREVGITFVYVTHDQEEALTMSRPDRGDEPRAGSSRSAVPEEVYERPDHDLRRRLHRRLQPDARRRVSGAGRGCGSTSGPEVAGNTERRSRPAKRCHAVVRPEKLRIDLAGDGDAGGNGLPRVEGWSRARSTWAPRRRSSSTSATTCG